ncbi:MAG: ComEC/Rec2 family competence protein [Firmicutes bacterium]|nr:ComEC/Rec2 family competence protein [Bacillota bacterium]
MNSARGTNIKKAVVSVAAIIAVVFFALNRIGIIDLTGSRETDVINDAVAVVNFIDVGQGDCELISLADGTDILIDAGNYSNRSEICSFLKTNNVDAIDLLVLTHPHTDHIGSASEIIKNFSVERIVMTDEESNSASYEYLLDSIISYDIPVDKARPNAEYSFGDCKLTILAPLAENNDLNECSIVCRLECGEVSFLFTGDAGNDSEQEMLQSGRILTSTVLKVGHHGSSTSSTKDFIAAVQPEFAVISCGSNNSYGHPHDNTLKRLDDVGAKVYRTDINGTVTVSTDGKNIHVSTEKK